MTSTVNKISKQALLICLFVGLFYCYEYYLRVAPAVMGAELKTAYRISDAGLGLLSGLFYWVYTPMQIPVGIMMDRFGPRKVLTAACLLCVIGTYYFTFSGGLSGAMFGRFLIGFGSAFGFVGVLKISDNWLPPKWYAPMVGICSLLGMVGASGGQILMAYWTAKTDWQTTLNHAFIAGIGLTLLMWLFIRDRPKHIKEKKKPVNTQLPISQAFKIILRDPTLWCVGLIGCFTFLPLSTFAELWAVPYLQSLGYDTHLAATCSTMIFVGFGVGGPLWGLLSDRIQSRRTPLIWGALVTCIALTLVVFLTGLPTWLMLGLFFVIGFFTSAEILVFAIANDSVPSNISATTVAFVNMLVMVGGLVLQPLIGKVLDILSAQSPETFANESTLRYQIALTILPLSLLMATFLAWRMKESYHKSVLSTAGNI